MEGPVDVKYQGAGSDSYGSDWWVRIHPDGKLGSTSARRTTRSTLRRLGCGRSAHATGITCRVRGSMSRRAGEGVRAMREKRLQERAAAPVPEETQEQVHVPLVLARRPWLARLSNSGRGRAAAEGPGLLYESPYVDMVTLADGTGCTSAASASSSATRTPFGLQPLGENPRRHQVGPDADLATPTTSRPVCIAAEPR